MSKEPTPHAPVSERDLNEFQALKPFIARCFSLNHEINNPLAGIIGYAEILLVEGAATLTESQRDSLKKIIACAERIKTEVEDLCQVKMGLAGKIDFDRFQKI